MDAQIRRLVVTGAEQNDIKLLSEAFHKLQQNFQVNLVQSKDTIGQDIYVLLAESALDLNADSITDECLQMFFSLSPVKSQFVGRAYLCQFRMYMPKTAQDFASLNNAIPFLQKCLSFASASPRYQFLVYNASVIYFNYVRPFFRVGYRKYLCDSFQQVIDTLINITDEQDYLWQAQLLFELVRCYMDANNMDKAREISNQLLQLCQTKQLPLLSNILQFLTVNNVFEPDDLSRYIPNDDPSSLFNRLLIELASIHREILENRTTNETNENLKNVFDRIVALPLRSAITANKLTKGLSPRDNSTNRLDKTLTLYEKHRLLVEAGGLSLLLRYTDLTKVILEALSNIRLKEPEFLLEVRLLQAEYMVKSLGENEQLYNKSSVDTRIRAIELTEETLESLVRTGQYDLVQAGCTTLWNLCLSLLQTNLRGKIRKALTTLVHILERIQSLDWLLRSQAHFELAKIEEDIEQLDSAKTNLLKAKQLDDTSIYSSRINLALERLHLRSELYKIPENIDDRVGIIIEQAGKSTNGNKNKQRALLIEACLLLAQDAFQVVLDSENPNAIGKMRANPTAQLKAFADHYEKCIQNTTQYERLISEANEDKRLKLWADLTMIARRQEIWDVCRTAARFCLLYDNEQRRSLLNVTDQSSIPNVFQRDLIRLLAEIHFIAGEAEIEFVRERRIELFDTPIRPPMPTVPSAQRAQVQQESDNDWKYYCQWLQQLSIRACTHFSTSAILGQLLDESWLVCRAGEYLWNYTRHLFYSNRLRLILDPLSIIVNGLKKVGYEREILLLINLCVALGNAYITPLPTSADDTRSIPNVETTPIPQQAPTTTKKGAKGDQQTTAASVVPAGSPSVSVKTEDLKAALDICEYAINQTNEDVAKPLSISIRDRQTLLQLWVTIKQQLQQSIKSSLSSILGDEDENTSSLNTLSRAVITVDILSRLDSGWHDTKDGMNLKQTVTFVDQCTWNDSLVELQLWCRLGIIANRANDIETTLYCRDKTLELITLFQTRKVEKFQLSLANEYVSRACGAHAECLLKQQTGQKQERKEVLAILVEAASYASKADLYELTMHLARHFWNTCRISIKRKLERSLLFDPLNELVHHINTVAPKSIVASLSDKETKEQKSVSTDSFKPKKQPLINKKDKKSLTIDDNDQTQITTFISNPQEDAQIRSALYGVLVQIYMDKHSWHSALDIIDNALQVLPRTQHRLLLYKYRVLIKSKLGLSISTDMQKFREQGELALAKMWKQVAIMAKKREHVINAYQHAIATLQSFDNYWTKIDYILELANWLFSNEYLIDNVIDLIEWSIDLLLTSPEAYKQAELNTSLDEQDTGIHNRRSSMVKSDQQHNETTPKAEHGSNPDQAHLGPTKPKLPNRLQPDLSIGEIIQVRRLEYLCRCHILLAYMTRQNQPEYEQLLQKAYWFLMRLWQRGLSDSNEINKDAETEAAAAAAAAEASVDAGKKQKAVPGSATKKKPPIVQAGKSTDKQATNIKSSTLDTSTPKNLSEWAIFVPNDDILQTYKLSQAKQRGFNKNTISKPLLSFYYLDMFVHLLRDYGYNHMSLPVLSFMRLIGQIILQSSSIRTYVLLHIQQVCQELNLLESMQTICQLARPFTIRDDDLATSRAEMIIYTKLLTQQREEETLFESALDSSGLKSEARSYGTSAYSSPMSRKQASDPKSLIADLPGDRQILNKLITRNIWLQTAHLLFELNFIQEAKEMLQEILNQAKTYDDQTCEKRAYILLGEIALYEHRFDQAIDLAMQGQQTPIDEHDWYRSVITVIEALRQDTNQDSYKQKKIRSLLETSIKRLESIAQLHINKLTSIAYAASLLSTKRIEVELNEILSQPTVNTIDNKPIFYRLHEILQQYDISYTNMLSLDRYNDACEIILTRSIPIWKRFARDTTNQNEQKKYLYQALNILEQLIEILAERWHLIRIITSQNDLSSIQLPIQRQFIRVQIEIISILLDLLKISAYEMFSERLRRKKTHATYLAVQDFVGKDEEKEENNDNDTNIFKWAEMIKTLPDKLIASIMSVLEIIGTTDKITKAKILFYLAQVYSILGQNFGTDYPLEWNIRIKDIFTKLNEMPVEKTGFKRMGSQTSSNTNQTIIPVDNESITEDLLAEFSRQKMELNHSMFYLGQAMELALQSLNIALSIQDKIVIRDCSLLLCEIIGLFDPISSIIYLILSQNASASIYTENILKRACHIPSDSELASLFILINRMKQNETITNANNGIIYRIIMERLKTYWPWKYMTIRPQYYDLIKDMPASFNFLILHYSSNSDILYVALFNSKMSSGKGTISTAATKQTTTKSTASTSGYISPQITKINVDKNKLNNLINKFNQWKQEYSQILQRYDIKLQYNRNKQVMLNSEQSDPVDISLINEFKQRFMDEFVVELNEYFSPVNSLLSNYLESEKQYELRTTLSSDHLILLVDPRLASLPLESLEIFKHVQIGGISRDFSIQSIYYRLNANISLDENIISTDDNKSKKGGAKEVGDVTSDLQVVDAANTYYLMEPVLVKSSTENKISTPFDLLRQRFPQLMAKWKTIKQDGSTIKSQKGIPLSSQQFSTVELERIISEAQGVVYYGAHTLSELIGSYKCPTLSKNGCTILCSFDRTSTSIINTPMSSLDDSNSIELDDATRIALLWSSGGIKSILLNQWKSTMNENESLLINLFTDITTLRCSLSQALRLYVYPYFRPIEIDPATIAATSKDTKVKGNITANKKARSPSPKNKEQQSQSLTKTNPSNKRMSSLVPPTEIISELSQIKEPIEERQRPALQLQQLNAVIFGLPNLTFTP
ncbi:unnamed protein product [Rotaria sordida]|uniref:Cilia- and flagella-associated protein 46 n=1 Tax=Rotaria sordida TaxID=392033 RepID=A0A813Q6Z1_9BILA|nr:unnamed protein product [Rotaria sordida]